MKMILSCFLVFSSIAMADQNIYNVKLEIYIEGKVAHSAALDIAEGSTAVTKLTRPDEDLILTTDVLDKKTPQNSKNKLKLTLSVKKRNLEPKVWKTFSSSAEENLQTNITVGNIGGRGDMVSMTVKASKK